MKVPFLAISAALLISLSGCISGSDVTPPDNTDEALEAPVITGPWLEQFSGATGNAVATPAISISNGGAYEFALNQENESVSGWVIEVTWDANGPESERLDLWIRDNGDYAVVPEDPSNTERLSQNQPKVKATGTSPLRLVLTPDQLDDDVGYNMLVRAATPAGASVEQAFDISVATFAGLDLDSEYAFA